MSVDPAEPKPPLRNVDEAKALASAIIAGAASEGKFDAQAILDRHPQLMHYPSIVVDLAYEEFCRRVDAGESADPREFVKRFPNAAESLLELLDVHRYLDKHPDALATGQPAAWPEVGDVVGGFTLVREIGKGGFSRVFLAQERELGDREVVVKICVQANEEAARLGRLRHPHIVPVHSVQTRSLPGFTLICMPYVGVATLADVLAEVFPAGKTGPQGPDVLQAIERANRQRGVSRDKQDASPDSIHWTLRRGSYAEAILKIGAELCEALAYAHQRRIYHCDVKPSNVLLTPEGRSLLLDFNLSRQRGGDDMVGGTLPYMAPEQLRFSLAADPRDLPEIDHRADLFAVGVTMFQLLTGRLPFPAEDLPSDRKQAAGQLLERQRHGEQLRRGLEQLVTREIAGVIVQCLAFDPSDRPSAAADVAQRFREAAGVRAQVRSWLRAHKRTLAFATAAALLAFSAFAAYGPVYAAWEFRCGIADLEAATKASQLDETVQLWSDAQKHFETSLAYRKTPESNALLAECRLRILLHRVQSDSPDPSRPIDFMGPLNHYNNAIESGLATPAVLNNRGYCLIKNEDYEEAVKTLQEDIKKVKEFRIPSKPQELQALHHNLALAHFLRIDGFIRTYNDQIRTQERINAPPPPLKGIELDTLLEESRGKIQKAMDDIHASLSSAKEHIDLARQFEPRYADLELDAAKIRARAYGSSDFVDDRKKLLNEAIELCEEAVRLGLPPSRLKEVMDQGQKLAVELKQNSRFSELLSMPDPPTPPPPAKRILEVLPDLRG